MPILGDVRPAGRRRRPDAARPRRPHPPRRPAVEEDQRSGLRPNEDAPDRSVPVPPTLETYVRDRIDSAPSGSYLFPSPTGTIWTNTNFRVRSRWTETTQTVGLAGTTIHDLRHTAASLLIAAGADVKAVQMNLGHATATMTMDLYGHLFSEAPWVAMERMPMFPELPRVAPAPKPAEASDERGDTR
ncbi:tyrosine-type recombinase/integrase [Cellulomonas sp. ICMP 17802]|uniref:tyrosine-type recombinase/integrase n=1 Tax=Cellulomonas sp. ICMP 17802 TaxID=3239199 RepID=UPI00351B13D2